ncbi:MULTISPECIES: carbon-phosphorus lyase complex subunit PhnI [unclassified Brenneria]|uniref:carbon-phosphorus lyase complex subunit PhnI n=1 Tax=unclassified Brenneria TaxID=2634434 RepID=UPI001556763A|nr:MULTISPECIES: carbon-phosphorus lyase complex subunit PhnI [unclassified Brenneria]MBJ7221985.1 carbon-phosphorus lyase complex subunit PhnI [Brenneria sp. L3-3C-1]MEE3643228.1 carbon-phosphorus lyase complex subunit PhnI [Brenneria sp. L3_3C_1]MEE3650583.1 carbon-phosphorus lyase complex subunit PhnI [Brenneria sp. HEZEL_4_2_4]NPD00538.1 carbon-phosphorus lyase complex subunit PhnI [Brenneria sp. hezel4-2-4]
MYVAVKGGEKAITAAHRLQERLRRGSDAELGCRQIEQQLELGVQRVMNEGGIYDTQLASLAIKQASGDLVEAIFLLRAYRTTLPRFMVSEPLDMAGIRLERRISAIYKDLPGGQILGPTYDYTHRLLDFGLLNEHDAPPLAQSDEPAATPTVTSCPRIFEMMTREGLISAENDDGSEPDDITRHPISYPCSRSARLQQLVRTDEGFLLALGYSIQRGYGRNHPFVGEIRTGYVSLSCTPEELGFSIEIGEILLTECEMVNNIKTTDTGCPCFTRGYGLVFGRAERKAMSMALVDRALRAAEYGETVAGPAQDEEFVLSHADSVDASGFISHLKLPHYVDFQSELDLLRQLRRDFEEGRHE